MTESESNSETREKAVLNDDLLVDLKRSLDAAVHDYEIAIMRSPTDPDEIRSAVDKCTTRRKKFNLANAESIRVGTNL